MKADSVSYHGLSDTTLPVVLWAIGQLMHETALRDPDLHAALAEARANVQRLMRQRAALLHRRLCDAVEQVCEGTSPERPFIPADVIAGVAPSPDDPGVDFAQDGKLAIARFAVAYLLRTLYAYDVLDNWVSQALMQATHELDLLSFRCDFGQDDTHAYGPVLDVAQEFEQKLPDL